MVRALAPLVYCDRVDGTHIQVGTGSWQVWLTKTISFRYESLWGSFTACKEYRGNETFWLAYRQVKEQLRCAELGATHDLTVDQLIDTVKQLNASNITPWVGKSHNSKISEAVSDKSDNFSEAIEANAVRQWCIFYTHPNEYLEFVGAYWEKQQALEQLHLLVKPDSSQELGSDLLSKLLIHYQVREELVFPIGYVPQRFEACIL